MSTPHLEIDGSLGEGGGQILRTSLTLSLITGKSFHLRNIRARRSKPGLQPQHLMCVRAAAKIGNATIRGASRGSCDLVFEPGKVTPGSYRFDIGTAGATGLVLHTLYLPLVLGTNEPSSLTLVGGTHVDHSPCFHFLDTTWRRYLELLGVPIQLRMVRAGFYPRGGGIVEAHLQPCAHLRGLKATKRGEVTVTGFSAVAGLPEDIAHRQARQAIRRLKQHDVEARIREETWDGGPGTVMGLIVNTTPAPVLLFGLGARGKRAEKVADEAVEQALAFLRASPAAVDRHSADQIVLPLALSLEPSLFAVTEVTRHLLTNIEVIREFLDRNVVCDGDEGGAGTVRIE